MLRVAFAAALVLAAPAAGAQGPPSAWDGTNPFRCELQQAGFGSEVPRPEADPYCVEFDKRRQNVTELGVVDFLSKEPARVSAASPKCFYFQSDHWRGSVVQSDGTTKTYEWDGHYFFDKARGEGGVWVTNFNFNGQTADPSTLPGMPPEYAQFFGPGTGGLTTHNEVETDPGCVAKAEAAPDRIYVPAARTTAGQACPDAVGDIGSNRLGAVTLGMSEARVRELLGTPARVHRGFLRYCLRGGGKLLVGVPGDRSGDGPASDGKAVFLLTTHAALKLKGVGRGATTRAVHRAFPGVRRRFVQGRTTVLSPRRGVLVGVRSGRVRFLAVYDPKRVRDLREWLRRSQ